MRLTDQQRRDRALSEADLRRMADDVAEILGWLWMWVGPLRTQHGWVTPTRGTLGEGWPDTTYINRKGRILFVEFKAELGKVSPAQERVHRLLRDRGQTVMVIRPSTFDELVQELR